MASSSSSSSASKKNPKRFKVDLDGNVYCNHDIISIPRVAGSRSTRNGEEFYGCPLWPKQDCKFFMWKKEFDECLKSCISRKDQENKATEMENLKLRNMLLQEENKNLKLQLSLKKSDWKCGSMLGLAIVVITIGVIAFGSVKVC